MGKDRKHYTEQDNARFLHNVAKKWMNQQPRLNFFDQDRTLDRDKLIRQYFITFRTTKGVLQNKDEIKRMQDQMTGYFIKYYQNNMDTLINQQNISFDQAILINTEQAKQFMMPYVVQTQVQQWKKMFSNQSNNRKVKSLLSDSQFHSSIQSNSDIGQQIHIPRNVPIFNNNLIIPDYELFQLKQQLRECIQSYD